MFGSLGSGATVTWLRSGAIAGFTLATEGGLATYCDSYAGAAVETLARESVAGTRRSGPKGGDVGVALATFVGAVEMN